MGGPSFHKEQEHQRVKDRYEEMLKEEGPEKAPYLSMGYWYDKLSDEFGYSVVSVRKIINKYPKKPK
jgi:hypothetical protein